MEFNWKLRYGEFAISRPTSINVSNPAFEIKRWVLYFVLSDFAPPPKKKTWLLYLVLCRGGGYQENDFLIVSDGFAHGFSPPLCAPGGGFIFVFSIFAPPGNKAMLALFLPNPPPWEPGGWLAASPGGGGRVFISCHDFCHTFRCCENEGRAWNA